MRTSTTNTLENAQAERNLYYGARYLDPTDAMWLSVDPLWKKYVEMTPYQYCAGNPVKLVDVDGREFTEEAKKWISRMNKYIDDKIGTYNDKISQCFDKLNKKNLSEKKISKISNKIKKYESKISEYNEVLKEIEVLRKSSQVYDVLFVEKYNTRGEIRSAATYNFDKNTFEIIMGGGALSNFAHELKHAYQFEMGDYSVGRRQNGAPFYDVYDEYEAYYRQTLFGGEKIYELNTVYKNIQNDRKYSVHDLENKSDTYLKNYARGYMCVFRYNGVTYCGIK